MNGYDLSNGYKYLREDYRYPGFYDIGPDVLPTGSHPLTFSSVEHLRPMETMEYYEYFSNPRQDLNPAMRVPVLLGTFLDRFESLEETEQERFLRAAFWFQHSSSLWEKSHSAAYLAIVTSIETLRTCPPRNARCEKCGSLLGTGATKQFKDVLDELLPRTEGDQAQRKELYRLRSAITHGGDLFHSDAEGTTGMNPKSVSEHGSHSHALRLARRAILNWLMNRTGGWPSLH